MTLPNPGMSFTPFDPLPAADLNDMVENIEAIADLSVFATGDIPRNLVANLGDGNFDYVASGLVWTPDAAGSTLLASMTAGVVYINGIRVAVSAVSNRAFTASRDTYVDVGVDGVVDYNPQVNNAASPALAANHMRIGIIVAGATNIASTASINQGQENKLLPIASSIPYQVTDSLGNLICPRDKRRRLLGYRQNTAAQGSITSEVIISPLTVPYIIPASAEGRKIRISLEGQQSNTGSSTQTIRLRDTNISGTVLNNRPSFIAAATASEDASLSVVVTKTAGSYTVVATITAASGTSTWNPNGAVSSLRVELE